MLMRPNENGFAGRTTFVRLEMTVPPTESHIPKRWPRRCRLKRETAKGFNELRPLAVWPIRLTHADVRRGKITDKNIPKI